MSDSRRDTWRGFYFTDHERMAHVVEKLDHDSRVVSIYYVINPCKPNLLKERAKCQCNTCSQSSGLLVENPTDAQVEQILEGPTQHLTSNEDVDTLQWLFIDIDTVRARGFEHESSTKEEKAAARAVANEVLAHLDSKGWPQPLLGDSGNGFHILPKINLLNTTHNIHLLVDCLKALAAKFDCAAAKIDSAVFNAARLTRAYGTTTRKGTHIEQRPYRRNGLVMPEAVIGEVSLDQILSLGSEVPIGSRDTGAMPELHLNSAVAAAAPSNCAAMKPGTSIGRMPLKVSVAARASATAGLANDVDAVNQYAAVM